MDVSYVRSDNNNIYIIDRHIPSLKCRQRGKYSNGRKVKPFKFISYKSMKDIEKKHKIVKIDYYTISKL